MLYFSSTRRAGGQATCIPLARWWWRCLVILALCSSTSAQAHLMAAQRGTLNLVGDSVYMVMSIPVTAFKGVDDDGDGMLSLAEGREHQRELEAQVTAGLQLIGPDGAVPVQGLMLTLSPSDARPTGPAPQVVVMGRFVVGPVDHGLKLRLALFGASESERTQVVFVTRGDEKQRLVLAPDRAVQEVLPSAGATLLAHLRLGAEHVLSGLDHLLFLLVVLAAATSLRQLALILTCFTAGHALTLAASLLGGLAVPAAIVEPAIAATIVGMALFDRWSLQRQKPWPVGLRHALVAGCAMIHGLGLAGALTDAGLDANHLLLSLAGFNLGVEAAQLSVALLAGSLAFVLRRVVGAGAVHKTQGLARYAAMGAGSLWFVGRVLGSL